MKICSVSWDNHPILGNLQSNFSKGDGTPYSTIVIAGENGTGKTSILDSLYDTCNFQMSQYLKTMILENGTNKLTLSCFIHTYGPGPKDSVVYTKAHFDDGTEETWDYSRNLNTNKIGTNPRDPRNDGVAFSSAQAIYQVREVQSISTKSTDSYNIREASKDSSPQELKQLLVDISAQDNADYAHLGQKNPVYANQYAAFESHSRMSRFKSAFNEFFDGSIRFDKVDLST